MANTKRKIIRPSITIKTPIVNHRYRYLHWPPHGPHYPRWAGIISLTALTLAILYIILR